jgi:hypothetical protein
MMHRQPGYDTQIFRRIQFFPRVGRGGGLDVRVELTCLEADLADQRVRVFGEGRGEGGAAGLEDELKGVVSVHRGKAE